MAPYRSREQPRAPRPAPQTGLVADMVRQFADAHAFVRELVQNGIDAGAAAIEVTVERSHDGVASVRVIDDGGGMSLAIIEDALLVLFRSTKDQDPSKIGKYGVGFMSVLAIEPSEVTVDTWRAGESHRVRLFPDHSYEIERAAPRDGHGTVVTLSKPLTAPEFEPFWQRVGVSLHRWCRHAELPIHFTVTGSAREPERRVRVDTPLDVRAIVAVRRAYEDMEIVLGPIAGSGRLPASGTAEDDPAPFAGFYNRGLTLYETTEPFGGLEGVRFKVKSRRLCHTLSRDDVRRDMAFHLALARARELRVRELRDAVLRELAIEAGAASREESAPRLAALLDAATIAPVSSGAQDLPLPLAHPIDGSHALTLQQLAAGFAGRFKPKSATVPVTAERTDLTRALAARGVPVAWAPEGSGVEQAIERASGGAVTAVPVAAACLLVRELPGASRLPGDDALCAELTLALERAGVERVALGHMSSGVGAFVTGAPEGAAEHVVSAESAGVATKKWPRGALLVLRAEAEAVACARRATSPVIGAHLLARYLLLMGPGLSSRAGEALAVRALEAIR